MKTRTILAVASVALLAACQHSERVSATTPTGSTTAVVAPVPGTIAVTPGAVVATPGVVAAPGAVAVAGSSTAIPIGSAKFGVTSDCNAASGGTVQGRTSATTMLDCAKLGGSTIR
jgi:hypothetical protein